MIQVARSRDQTGTYQRLHHRRSHALDIHGVTGCKVGQMPQPLGRAFRAGTADMGSILVPNHRGAADRAVVGQSIGSTVCWPELLLDRDDLRNDLPCFLDQYGISDADILFRNKILIVERSIGNGGSGQAHRLHYRLGCEYACAAHLNHNVHHLGALLLRRILECGRPAGKFCSAAQHVPL